MAERDLIINEHDIYKLNLVLTKIVDSGQCDLIMVINKSGRLISYQAEANAFDKVSLAALVVGSFASSSAIAHIVGEKEFETLYQEGVLYHLYVVQIDHNNIITAIFTDRSNLMRVKTVINDCKSAVADVLENMYARVVADPFLNLDVSSYKKTDKK
ncbi:MAG: roadblock/LC7 domain-containing protein [Chitinivibrionia bacterium]|nr:roadblock/LC7 domain-containing protein [Chitinivibrionia bacterium]